MEIIKNLDQLNIKDKTSVALGNFDGIHVGHREIFRAALDAAGEQHLRSLCFTFSNHPFNFILGRDESEPDAIKLICTEEEKIALIEEMGFDILVNVPFDENIMKMRAKKFFDDILRNKLNAGFISVGFNYTFGARAEGKPEMLMHECEAAGIGVSVHDAVTVDGKIVSSTLIREMIADGNMEAAGRYLGRPLSFSGIVEHGRKIGSAHGMPTANLAVQPERMVPPKGVYFTRALTGGVEYKCVSNIGTKPTVSTDGITSIETKLFDFDGDLYGKHIVIYFDHFSRPEVRFSSMDELFEQISKDCSNALEYHGREIK